MTVPNRGLQLRMDQPLVTRQPIVPFKTRGSLMKLMIQQIKNQVDTESMRPIHPGQVLLEEFLTPCQLTIHALSMALEVLVPRINDIVRQIRTINLDTALYLAKYFGNSAEFWMGLQTDFDMAVVRQSMQDALDRIREYQPAQDK